MRQRRETVWKVCVWCGYPSFSQTYYDKHFERCAKRIQHDSYQGRRTADLEELSERTITRDARVSWLIRNKCGGTVNFHDKDKEFQAWLEQFKEELELEDRNRKNGAGVMKNTTRLRIIKSIRLTVLSVLSLALIAEEYNIGALRWLFAKITGWMFAWVWDTPWLSLIWHSPGRFLSVAYWLVIVTATIVSYFIAGSLATGTIVAIARRLGLNPAKDTQFTFLIFWPIVLVCMLMAGWVRGTAYLVTPICKMFYNEGIKGVDKPIEIVTGKTPPTEALIKKAEFYDAPVSLFAESDSNSKFKGKPENFEFDKVYEGEVDPRF